ncbi:MAG: hypothetical protein FWC38_01645 [Proteobacteria bacterium]|nr:hypothetical protein [Pseudomonadota bacterium]MCL2306944.1 hypothetical protein [Pseudomonadota bacterium]
MHIVYELKWFIIIHLLGEFVEMRMSPLLLDTLPEPPEGMPKAFSGAMRGRQRRLDEPLCLWQKFFCHHHALAFLFPAVLMRETGKEARSSRPQKQQQSPYLFPYQKPSGLKPHF